MSAVDTDLSALAAYFRDRRGEILARWRSAVKKDPALTTANSLPRAQLQDHVPLLLESYEQRLCSDAAGRDSPAPDKIDQRAAVHGLHRWQQGYALSEVSRELGRLNECVVFELEAYALAHRELDPAVMSTARRLWAELSSLEFSASIAEYFRLQQVEAAGHLSDLEQALASLRELERQRAALWHEAAHDLRGNVSVVVTATAGLNRVPAEGSARDKLLRILERNADSLRHLLDDVTDLARLQAGREHRQLAEMNVAPLLGELCEGLRAQAEQRGLSLKFDGPSPFIVEGDPVKIRRLTQNLMLNAIKYTRQGGVTVTWGDSAADDAKRWVVSVRDTGPGFDSGPGAQLVAALGEATELTRESASESEVESGQSAGSSAEGESSPARTRAGGSGSAVQEQGEGIGLSIVKRLAELLDASIEVESLPGQGTMFRVYLPRQYAA